MEQIIREKPVTIKSHGERDLIETRAAIISVIAKTALNLAQYLQPTKEQISAACDGILSHFNGLSIDDLILCMDKGLMGHFGEIMRFDVSVILGWLTKYKEEKRVCAVKMPPIMEPRDNGEAVKMPPEVKEAFAALKAKPLLVIRVEGPDFTPDEEAEFLHGPKAKKFKRGAPIGPSDLEIEAWRVFDLLRKDTSWVKWAGHTYNMDEWASFFVLKLYPNEVECDKFYEYLETKQK